MLAALKAERASEAPPRAPLDVARLHEWLHSVRLRSLARDLAASSPPPPPDPSGRGAAARGESHRIGRVGRIGRVSRAVRVARGGGWVSHHENKSPQKASILKAHSSGR